MEGENVIGYVDNLTSFGIIAPSRKSLIVTDKRLLLLDPSSVSSNAVSAGFAYAFGMFGRGAANRITKDDIQKTTEKLAQANLDDLIKSNSKNVAIDNANVEKIEISRKNIVIMASGKRLSYGLSNPDARDKKSDVYSSYVEVLEKAFGSKVAALE